VIETFEGYDYLVAPSGSCAGHIATHYVELFDAADPWKARAERLAAKSHELVSFLVDVLGVTTTGARFAGTVTWHDSCSGLREMGVRDQPRKLLAAVDGLTLTEMKDPDVCCGFGGTFSVKYPDLSGAIVDKKTTNVVDSGAKTLLAGDMGCLMNMAGRLSRRARRSRSATSPKSSPAWPTARRSARRRREPERCRSPRPPSRRTPPRPSPTSRFRRR
jgi:L-lactate dehydrogenase complex protein LldE